MDYRAGFHYSAPGQRPRLFHLLTGEPESGGGKIGTEGPQTSKTSLENSPQMWGGSCAEHRCCRMRDIVFSNLSRLALTSN